MGKATVRFSKGMFSNGLPLLRLNKILNCLEKESHLLSFSTSDPIYFVVEIQNDDLEDGTIVDGYWNLHTNPVSNFSYPIFSRIIITDPPVASSSLLNYLGTPGTLVYNPTIGQVPQQSANPINSGSPTPTGQIALPPNFVRSVSWHDGPDPVSTPVPTNPACTCGAHKVGGLHSNWCDKKN